MRDEATKNMKRTVKKIVRETADEVVRVSRSFQQKNLISLLAVLAWENRLDGIVCNLT